MTASLAMQAPIEWLCNAGIVNGNIDYQLSPKELVAHALQKKQGVLNSSGALVIKTGQFTGRSPLDKFIVRDSITSRTVDWNKFNQPIDEIYFWKLKEKLCAYLNDKEGIYVRDCMAGADGRYQINIRCINESPADNLFAHNMFLRPGDGQLECFEPDWEILSAPGFNADPATDGVRQSNFAIISFAHKTILIGGTGYTGEIKKGIFSVLNFILPQDNGVLGMHCSANMGKDGSTALFFGLSGTGKTTLSADPNRRLIGDDEHGWSNEGIFNFEGGCYAKLIDLDEEKEPDIYHAIKEGALVENTVFMDGTDRIDFASKAITENTRVSYPLDFIDNALIPSIGPSPKNIFFLTCDAYGVLPPISKLTTEQAKYWYISGYTAKVAGTEMGIAEPKATFSACFGAPFLPLHPTKYAEMLGKRIKENNVQVWLVNTGWTGGSYGTGQRIKLAYTRAIISAALNGYLDNVQFSIDPVFGLSVPEDCLGVPSGVLNQQICWTDMDAYDATAKKLVGQFTKNFLKYSVCNYNNLV